MLCYDVVPIRNNYRGMGRTLIATELITKQTKKIFKELLELYFGYISVTLESPSEAGLIKIIEFCNILKRYNILCEVIAYDLLPLDNVFGYELEYLGIDIVHDMAESLLSDCTNNQVNKILNENGLCDVGINIDDVVKLLEHGGVEWMPCYVYKVVN